jgi:sirohydrochlorin cobaltochelatase
MRTQMSGRQLLGSAVRPISRHAATLLLACVASVAGAQEPSSVGTLIVAHGGGPSWDGKVDSIARAAHTGGPVAVSLLMGPGANTHRFQDAVDGLVARGAHRIVIIPMFVSSHSGHIEQIRYLAGLTDSLDDEMKHHLGMAGITRSTKAVPMRVTPALDDAAELAMVLADHALRLSQDPRRDALFLIGHGPNSAEDHASWMENLRVVADNVQRATSFRDVKVGLVRDDAPPAVRAEAVRQIRETIRLQYALTGRPVVVVPILVSSGSVSTAKIPADLADLPVRYDAEPLLPHPAMARWIERRARSSELVPSAPSPIKAATEAHVHGSANVP